MTTSARSPLQTAGGLTLTLNNGLSMPALGLGVFQSTPEETASAVATAIGKGYRLIDTAAVYFNEKQVGEGIARSGVARSELFVTTKLWISDFGHDSALKALDASLRRLGLDQVDLYLLHWPVPGHFAATRQAYKAAEKILADGRARAIGVSNFSPRHLQDLMAEANVVPAVNQVELNPYFAQRELREANARLGIITQAWSPLGGVNVYGGGKSPNPLQDAALQRLAQQHGKTVAQIILRWHVQHGISAIPKSVKPQRIEENFQIFDFELNAAEMAAIDALDTGRRAGPDPEKVDPELINVTIDNAH